MEIQNLMSKLKGEVREVSDEDITVPDDLSGLDDEGDILTPDPPAARRSAKAPRKVPPKPTKAVQSQVTDALTMMITLPAGIMAFRDPICSAAVLENADNIVAKLVPIVCRNPAMLRWFTDGAGYMDFFALATAIAPVARTIWAHHVSHSIEEEDVEDGGEQDYNRYVAPGFSS